MIRSKTIYATLLLCVLTMHTVTHSLILPGFHFSALQTSLAEQSDTVGSITSGDSLEAPSDGDYKPPKQSFIDYSAFLAPDYLVHAYSPNVSRLLPHEPFLAPPQVFLEIDVPPDHA